MTNLLTLLILVSVSLAGGSITIRDSSRTTIGHVDADGTLRDGTRSTIGRIDGCTARSANRSTTGYFDGCSSSDLHAMAAWIFFMNK